MCLLCVIIIIIIIIINARASRVRSWYLSKALESRDDKEQMKYLSTVTV